MRSKIIALGIVLVLLASGIGTAMAFPDTKVEQSLVAYWAFDEGSGTTVYDSSGNENDGTIHGATWTSGKVGGALEFDGKNNYAEVPDNPSLCTGSGEDVTIEVWVMTTVYQQAAIIAKYKSVPPRGGFQLSIDNKGDVLFHGRDRNGYRISGLAGVDITDGNWHQIVGMRDGSVWSIWVDGTLKNSNDVADTSAMDNPISLVIGCAIDVTGVDSYFNGIIDEVAIYSRALTPEEIKAHYEEYALVPPTPTTKITPTLPTPPSGKIKAVVFSNSGGGDWSYYKEITVKENSGKTLTDYQVFVELNPSNFPATAKSDGSDLRFEDASGKELSYWIDEWDAGAKKAKVWVKVPSIPANGETKIKMYYGNPSAGAVSDGDKVFEFFDDFSRKSLDTDKWIIFGNPKMTFSNSILDISGSCGAENANGDVLESKKNFNYPLIYEAYYKYDHTPWGNYAGIGLGRYSYPVSTHCAMEVDNSCYDNKGAFEIENGDSVDGCEDWIVNDWEKTKIVWTDKFVSFERGSAICTFTSSIPSQSMPVHLGDSYFNRNEFIQLYVDWIFIHKYASIEPTLTLSAEIPIERKTKFEISGPYIIPKFLSPNRIVDNALLGTYIDNEIKLGISNDEDVKKVICKFKSPAGFIAVQDLELSKTGGLVKSDGYEYYNYEGEIKARSLKPLIGWLISFFGTGFSSHADAHEALIDLTPPVTLEKVIITDVYGAEHELDVNKPLVSIEDHIFNPSPINPAFLDYKYVATYSPVHILMTDEEGNKIGWEEGNEFKEIENAVYSGADIHPEFIIIFQPKLTYSLNVSGVKSGDFTLHIVSANATAKTVSKFEKISATANTKAFIQITEKAQEMSVDYDGDGKIDEEKEPVGEVIEVIPEIPTPSPSPTPTPSPPGFEALFAIAGLLAVAYVLRRKR